MGKYGPNSLCRQSCKAPNPQAPQDKCGKKFLLKIKAITLLVMAVDLVVALPWLPYLLFLPWSAVPEAPGFSYGGVHQHRRPHHVTRVHLLAARRPRAISAGSGVKTFRRRP